MKRLTLCCILFVGCRTEIVPIVKRVETSTAVRRERPAECNVNDFPSATDLPAKSENIGWIEVPRQPTDEETYLLLRKTICERGGDALSQLQWVKEPGQYEPTALRANAWVLP
jgi:hypothetical protein